MAVLQSFYYHPRMLSYNFGPHHPFSPERWRRTIILLEWFSVQTIDPGEGKPEDLLRVHSRDFVTAVEHVMELDDEELWKFGFSSQDTPPFPGMYQAALACLSGSAQAARDVCAGAALAYNICGGLHHSKRSNASGFCVFDDCAVAIHILKERFERIAYVDIDVHHGDGVQAIFYDDPTVLTCSIHQDGRTLYPGTGFQDETGAQFSSLNVPLAPNTTGDVWIWAFRNGIMPALREFKPEAVVLQMGADSHLLDPLARIQNTAQEWLEAVLEVKNLGLPIVALGGGGYNFNSVVRMWVAACLALADMDVPESVPSPFAEDWDMPFFFDRSPQPRNVGREQAERVVAWIEEHS